ncbi:hypothetical protein LCGC14_2403670 [marine sediment metagenome]|uniref:Uncharacterized protein n=1 Tax=marine sediment metagenome TaxID=412755 RepID=A0A0F9ENZ0_9ZZZZ
MAEIMTQLEALAYLASQANSVKERRELDEILRETETKVDELPTNRIRRPQSQEVRTVCGAVGIVSHRY